MQRLFARAAWRMRSGWASDVPFVEKLPVIGADCGEILQGAEPSIEADDCWGGCENSEPDVECAPRFCALTLKSSVDF
jgi:hypothetical protein